MKVIEWFKSLFKKKEIINEPVFVGGYTVKTTPVEEAKSESASTTLEEKPIAKKKKRGRPRKKKVEQK